MNENGTFDGMIPTQENWNTQIKTCPSANWLITNSKQTGLVWNVALQGMRPVTNCLNHGTDHIIHYIYLFHTWSVFSAIWLEYILKIYPPYGRRILYCVNVPYSHPKYRAVLTKKFPSLACATEGDTSSVASGDTNVSEGNSPAAWSVYWKILGSWKSRSESSLSKLNISITTSYYYNIVIIYWKSLHIRMFIFHTHNSTCLL